MRVRERERGEWSNGKRESWTAGKGGEKRRRKVERGRSRERRREKKEKVK